MGKWLLGLSTALAALAVFASEPDAARQNELLHLLRHDCGSCHGMTLNGGLGPALTPEALAQRHPQYLIVTIREGRPGTPMPPWRDFLSESDTAWLVDTLLRGSYETD